LSPVGYTEPWRKRLSRHLRRGPWNESRHVLNVIRGSLRTSRTAAMRPSPDYTFDYRGALAIGRRYTRDTVDMAMELFVTEEAVHDSGSESLYWTAYHRGPLRLHRLPGGHDTVLDVPDIHRLISLIDIGLRRRTAHQPGSGDNASAGPSGSSRSQSSGTRNA